LASYAYGAEKSTQRLENLQAIEHFSARLEVLPFPAKAATHCGQIRAELERLGKPVGRHDMLIGAHARAEGLVVVTNNAREFQRVPGLRVENWV
jgi:tRNA(fMet)-specific endonuclease VapC